MSQGHTTFVIPMPGRRSFFFEGPFPFSEEDWVYVQEVLQLFIIGLTKPPPLPIEYQI